jgi:hypothetical protein
VVSPPAVSFSIAPPLVVVAPGVQVVEDYDEEVYFVDGWYWMHWQNGWYRTRHHHGGWVIAPGNLVPVRLVSMPRGKYKKFKVAKVHGHGGGHGGGGHGKHHGGGKKKR